MMSYDVGKALTNSWMTNASPRRTGSGLQPSVRQCEGNRGCGFCRSENDLGVKPRQGKLVKNVFKGKHFEGED